MEVAFGVAFSVCNIVEEPVRVYLIGTLDLSTFICNLLIFMEQFLADKESSQKL